VEIRQLPRNENEMKNENENVSPRVFPGTLQRRNISPTFDQQWADASSRSQYAYDKSVTYSYCVVLKLIYF